MMAKDNVSLTKEKIVARGIILHTDVDKPKTKRVTKPKSDLLTKEKLLKHFTSGSTLTDLADKRNEVEQLLDAANAALKDKLKEFIEEQCEEFAGHLYAKGADWDLTIEILRAKWIEVNGVNSVPVTKTHTTRSKVTTAGKQRKDLDSTGQSPIPGATYKLDSGEIWTKLPTGKGSPKKNFLSAVKEGGKNWIDLLAN